MEIKKNPILLFRKRLHFSEAAHQLFSYLTLQSIPLVLYRLESLGSKANLRSIKKKFLSPISALGKD